jgi:hypothetical protein
MTSLAFAKSATWRFFGAIGLRRAATFAPDGFGGG